MHISAQDQPSMPLGCRWCKDDFETTSQLWGHVEWSHRAEFLAAVTRPQVERKVYTVPRCTTCQQRELDIDRAAQRHLRPSELFGVTAYADRREGHVLFYSPQGEITLCQARKLELPVWAKQANGVSE